jgi:hypothetical protein
MMPFSTLMNFVIKLWLSDLPYHPFTIGRFLISSPSPYDGEGWDGRRLRLRPKAFAPEEGLWSERGWIARLPPP